MMPRAYLLEQVAGVELEGVTLHHGVIIWGKKYKKRDKNFECIMMHVCRDTSTVLVWKCLYISTVQYVKHSTYKNATIRCFASMS